MPKFKWTFPKELRPTMEQVLENEQTTYKNANLGPRGPLKWVLKKAGIAMLPTNMSYEFVSDTEAIVKINTGMDWAIRPEALLKKLKEYEDLSRGQIKIKLIKEDKDE